MSDSDTATDSDDEYDAFNQFANGDPLRIMDWIRMKKVDVNAHDGDHGDSLLIWASNHKIDTLVRFLVRKGAEINYISNTDGHTALDNYLEDPVMSDYLRKHGAKTSRELWDEAGEEEAEEEES